MFDLSRTIVALETVLGYAADSLNSAPDRRGYLSFRYCLNELFRDDHVIVNRHRGQIAAGASSNAIRTIEKSRSERGHDRRRSRPHSDVDFVTCHKQLPRCFNELCSAPVYNPFS